MTLLMLKSKRIVEVANLEAVVDHKNKIIGVIAINENEGINLSGLLQTSNTDTDEEELWKYCMQCARNNKAIELNI